MASYDESDGVWRTVGGRRIFIREGQSLGDAMKASGKFKKASKVKRSEYQTEQAKLEKEKADQRLKDLTEEHPEAEDTKELEGKHIKEKNKKHAFEKEPEDKEQEEDLYQEFKEKGAIGQSYSEYKAQKETGKTYKLDTTKLDGEYHNLPERTSEEQASDERYANAKAMYKLTGDEKYKKAYQEEIEKSTERIRQKVETEKGSSKTYAPEDLEQGKPYEIDMGNGIKKTAIYMGKDEEGNSSFYDGEGVGGTFGFSDKFMKENIKISDNKDDDKFMELHNQIKKETAPGKDKYSDYYKKENLGEPSNYQEGDEIEFRSSYDNKLKGEIVREATDEEKRYQMNTNLKGYIVKDNKGSEHVVPDTKIDKESVKAREMKDNPYATNNKGGSDDNSSEFAREARDYWDNKNLDYKASHDGKEDEMAVNFRDRWDKELKNREYGEKKASEKPKTYQEYYGLKDNRNEMTVKEYEDGNIDQQELKDMLRRGGESEDTIHKIVKANTGANSRDERIRNLFNDTEKEKAEYARGKAEEYKNTKDPMFQDVKEERAKGYEKQAKEAESRIDQSSKANGLNSKADYEHDLKWFEDMEKSYPTKGGLKDNEDYQSLKAQYESEFKTKWNSGSEAKETPKYRWKDIDGKTIEPGDYKRAGGGSLVKQNEDGTSVHIATTRKGDGSLEYTRYDYDANGDTGKGKTYKSLEEAKAGKTGNEAMNDKIRTGAKKTPKITDNYNEFMEQMRNAKRTSNSGEFLANKKQWVENIGEKPFKYLTNKEKEKVLNGTMSVGEAYDKGETRRMEKEKENTNNVSDSLRRKAYNKYMKEHPNSKKTFEDFMKK